MATDGASPLSAAELLGYIRHLSSCRELQPIPLGSDAFCDCGREKALAHIDAQAQGVAALQAQVDAQLVIPGQFVAHSGGILDYKIECDSLSDRDIEGVAGALALMLSEFGSVEGVPRGGLRLAKALEPFATKGPLLIVDDVCTTGASLEAHRAGRDAIGAVIFNRGHLPSWCRALFHTNAVVDALTRERDALLTHALLLSDGS